MDGSTSAFLPSFPSFSTLTEPSVGILYIEDFDLESHAAVPLDDSTTVNLSEPAWTSADIEAARAEGRLAGIQAALDDAHLLQAQIQAAATQSLADALRNSQTGVAKAVAQAAEEGVRLMLGVLQAAVPVLMQQHAAAETEALLQALLPGVTNEPELHLRTSPEAADSLREMVANLVPHGTAILSVAADAALAPGDVQISWRDGGARRDTRKIWAAIREALAPLRLPPIEELCRGCGC